MNKDTLKLQMKEAMKAKDTVRLSVIRSLLSAIQYEEMEQSTESLPESDVLALIRREIKKRQEELEFIQKTDRQDQMKVLQTELSLLDNFLPQQLSEAQIESILQPLAAEVGSNGIAVLMKHLKENYGGQYDGKLASEIAKRVLTPPSQPN
jgi:uncharacterized protein